MIVLFWVGFVLLGAAPLAWCADHWPPPVVRSVEEHDRYLSALGGRYWWDEP